MTPYYYEDMCPMTASRVLTKASGLGDPLYIPGLKGEEKKVEYKKKHLFKA